MQETPLVPRTEEGPLERAMDSALQHGRSVMVVIVDNDGITHVGFKFGKDAPNADAVPLYYGAANIMPILSQVIADVNMKTEGQA